MTNSLRGVNPANGIVIYYNLPELAKDQHIELTITDATGKPVNRFSSKKNEDFQKYDGGPSAPPTLSKDKGLNRFVWNMRYAGMPGIPTAYIEGSYRGHKAIPGQYKLTLAITAVPSSAAEAKEGNPKRERGKETTNKPAPTAFDPITTTAEILANPHTPPTTAAN